MTQKLKRTIAGTVEEIIRKRPLNRHNVHVELESPKDKRFGDWSVNTAMKIARDCRKPPLEIARLLSELLQKELASLGLAGKVDRIEVKPPGFINIYLSREALFDVLSTVQSEGQRFGSSRTGRGQKVLIEFVSANPTGPLSIAHARQAAVGDTLANILTFAGYRVEKEYYINDEGNQIRNLGLSLQARYLETIGKKNVIFPENGYKGQYLYPLAEELAGQKEQAFLKEPAGKATDFFASFAVKKILEEIKTELEEFGVHFDNWYSQKKHITLSEIESALAVLRKGGYIYEEDGAVWFQATQFGDDKDRVIIKSDKQPTYLCPDIAYHKMKFERGFDRLVNIWGPDHHGYINRLKAAVCALGHKADDLKILIIQLASLFRNGKPVAMSTRAGEYITLRELIREVGRDAARFFFLMRRCDSQLEFDLELAKKHSLENPVYYVQYAHARISGIRKTFMSAMQLRGYHSHQLIGDADASLLTQEEEVDIIRKLHCFHDVVTGCALTLDPQGLTTYLRELAGDFHAFYNKHRVYSEDSGQWELSKARFLLVDCVRQVIHNGLMMMGVHAPEEM